MAKILSRAEILGATDLVTDSVNVPEWGGDVRVTELSAAERVKLEEAFFGPGAGQFSVRTYALQLVQRCAIDEAGARLFAPEDLDALGERSPVAIDRVFQAALKVNGLLPGAVEDAGKNSSRGPDAAASSA